MRPARLRVQRVRLILETPWGEAVRELTLNTAVVEEGFLKLYRVVELHAPAKPGTYVARVTVDDKRPYVSLLSQAEVIKLMRERGIGRPSTYAKIVETLFRRRYVTAVGSRRDMVAATDRGLMVYGFLISRFPGLVSENVTRRLEEKMDMVEQGRADYRAVLEDILAELCEAVEKAGFKDYLPPGACGKNGAA